MTTRRLAVVVAFLGIALMASRAMIDSDTWWHLRAGEWIVQHAALPNVDIFSYTRYGEAWHYPGWLSEIMMYGMYALSGLTGVTLFFTGIILLACWVIYRTLDGSEYLRAFVMILAAAAATIYWSARPQLFTFLFGAVFFLVLHQFLKTGRNRLWILPVLMILWVNIHGGFAVGFIFIAIAVLGEGIAFLWAALNNSGMSTRKFFWLCGTGVVCLLAAIVNPYGAEMWMYPFRTVAIPALQNFIQEWQSPNFHFLNAQLFLVLLFASWLVVAFSRRERDFRDLLYLSVIGYMGFLAWRNTILLSIVAPVVLTHYGQSILDRYIPPSSDNPAVSKRGKIINAIAAAVLGIAVLPYAYLSTNAQSIDALIRKTIPVDAVKYLADHPGQGHLLNSYNWGSYLLWNLPEYPVFVDGRTDVYSGEIMNQYLGFIRGQPGWEETMERWDIRVTLLEPTAPILQILELEGWQVQYQDSQAVILREPEN